MGAWGTEYGAQVSKHKHVWQLLSGLTRVASIATLAWHVGVSACLHTDSRRLRVDTLVQHIAFQYTGCSWLVMAE